MNSSDTNSGGYDSSQMHTSTLPSIFNQIQSDVKSAIKPVIKKASAGSRSSAIVNTNCNLFLLSEIEIFGVADNSASGEGTQYAYWKQHNSNDDRRKGPQNNPTSYYVWWERSPKVTGLSYFCNVHLNGGEDYSNASFSNGVSFAFCLGKSSNTAIVPGVWYGAGEMYDNVTLTPYVQLGMKLSCTNNNPFKIKAFFHGIPRSGEEKSDKIRTITCNANSSGNINENMVVYDSYELIAVMKIE